MNASWSSAYLREIGLYNILEQCTFLPFFVVFTATFELGKFNIFLVFARLSLKMQQSICIAKNLKYLTQKTDDVTFLDTSCHEFSQSM